MSSDRNRSEGWKHAKLTGHENEELVTEDIKNDKVLQDRILHAAKKDGRTIVNIKVGGLTETEVESVFGDKTKSKTDMTITLDDGSVIGVSIKKSLGGQVYLISPDRFIQGFEKQFNKTIPENIKRAIALYWGTASDVSDIVNKYGSKNKDYELRKHRLTANTLKGYDEKLYKDLLIWFDDNMEDIYTFCFSSGLAKNKKDWADLVWYKNDLNEVEVDEVINIMDTKIKLKHRAYYGSRTGGSTIQLPFGFVQRHSPTKKIPGDMQFHHSYEDIMMAINEYTKAINLKENK